MDEITTYKFLGLDFCFEEVEPLVSEDFSLSSKDKNELRELAKKNAEYAADPINEKRKKQWISVNKLNGVKPMVWFDEVCWHEMNVDDELTLRTEHPFCRQIEAELRQQIYLWNHMPGDMVIEPIMYSPLAITNTGIGLQREMAIVKTDDKNDVVSRHFIITIKDEEDIEKIRYPQISHNNELSDIIESKYHEIFDGILAVERRGAPGFWFAPWDDIVMFTGVQEALLDLAMRPDYIKKIVSKLVDIGLYVLDRYEETGLLSSNNYNTRIGSGAYGYTDELPRRTTGIDTILPKDIWGSCTAQIFAEVSPEMHEEFALQYERKWLERFGLTYYGCCEPLHHKMEQLRTVKNLRKVSISPFADLYRANETVGDDFVISYKPSPSVLAGRAWDADAVKKELKENLNIIRDRNVEMIMKDISTVKYQPHRLWEWVRIATEVSEELMG
jgi:hypothetical protein